MVDTVDILDRHIKNRFIEGLFTALPAKVIRTDKFQSLQIVDVKPSINKIYEDGVVEKFDILYNVPVVLLGGGGSLISVPVSVGDNVLLIFSMRDIDRWKAQGGEDVTPDTNRTHNINDAIAIPGLVPQQNVDSPSAEDVVIKFNGSQISLKKSKDIEINSSGNVNITSSGNINLGEGGAKIARLGDSVEVEITSGSSTGVWTGTIASAGNNTSL